MAVILHINTAFQIASVFLSDDEKIIAETQNDSQKDHSSFLEPAIKKICSAAQLILNNIDAVCVVNGPGSYTGLRVGLSSAKALCYALQKPLILLNTLDVMAHSLKPQSPVQQKDVLFCPLIDARRMEVFTALYDADLNIIKNYTTEILDDRFLEEERKTKKVIAGGSGSIKLKEILNTDSIIYINTLFLSKPTVFLANKAFHSESFSSVAYSEPFYFKTVYFKK